jgi:HlyD family secretion protein
MKPRWIVLAVVLGLVLLYATGVFEGGRVAPGRLAAPEGLPPPPATATAVRGEVPVVEEAVGSVRSRERAEIAAQVVARVVAVRVRVGDTVVAGQPLVTLDDADFAARFTRAKAQHERVRRFLAKEAATPEQMEAAEAEYRQASAALAHTRIAAPGAGVVAERHVEPGDLALPGRPLLVVLDPHALRLEASVREGLVDRVTAGATLPVVVPAAGAVAQGTVVEVFPAADPRTRTFEVRVEFDPPPGVHAGMFGRLRIPVGSREAVRVPAAAVERVGQLETVIVEGEDGWRRRLVTTGAGFDDGTVEVLSGLAGGERVGLPGPGG